DEAGDDYVTGDVDHLGVARFEIWADGGDFVPLHENVPARENAQFPVHGDDVTTSSSLRSATVPSKTCHTIVHRRGYSGQGPHLSTGNRPSRVQRSVGSSDSPPGTLREALRPPSKRATDSS